MSALLKAGDRKALSVVRPLGAKAAELDLAEFELPPLSGAGMAQHPREDERIELEAVIAELHQRLADAENEADVREDEAFARGRREGEDLATGETEKRLDMLRAGLEAMQQAHFKRLAEYELLALQLSRTALGRIFSDGTLQAELVAETIARKLAATKRELVLGLRVSPRDFRSHDELRELEVQFPGMLIEQDETLDAGGCAVDLRLGTIDLGLPGQWQRLSAFFEQLGVEGSAT